MSAAAEEPGGGRREDHRALEWDGHLCRQRHRASPLEIRPARAAIFITGAFYKHPDGHEAWVTASDGDDPGAPDSAMRRELFNVIDSRQAYPQQVVVAALRALGYGDEADHLKHFAYNVVALTPRCAIEMGYEIPPEDAKRPYIEMSGRKGQGVKADDLLDQLEASARRSGRAPSGLAGKRAGGDRACGGDRGVAIFSAAVYAFDGDRFRFQGRAEF